MSPTGTVRTVTEVARTPGGLGWLPDGTLLSVSQTDRRILRLGPNGLDVHADLGDTGEAPLNDMWVDEPGNAYVGDVGFDVHAV